MPKNNQNNNNPQNTPAPKRGRFTESRSSNNLPPPAPNRNYQRAKRSRNDSENVTRTIYNNLAFTANQNLPSTLILSGMFANNNKELTPANIKTLVTACKTNKLADLQIIMRHMWQGESIITEVANLLLTPNASVDLEKIYVVQCVNEKVVECVKRTYDEANPGGDGVNMNDKTVEEAKAFAAIEIFKIMKQTLNRKLARYATEVDMILVLDDDITEEQRSYWYKLNASTYDVHDCKMPANLPIVSSDDNNEDQEKINDQKLNIKLKNLAKTISHSVISRNFQRKKQRTALTVSFIR